MTSENLFLDVKVTTTDGNTVTHSYPLPADGEACTEGITSIMATVDSATGGGEGSVYFAYPPVTYNRHYIVRVEYEARGLHLAEQVAEELQKRPLGFPTA